VKIWYHHGAEHSANLVMIGHFNSAADASMAKEVIDAITKQVADDESTGALKVGGRSKRYGTEMLDLLAKLNVMSLSPVELEQFAYDISVELRGNDIVLTTEEIDISAFIKILFDRGARIEVYSAHNHPDSEFGRGRR
jgi:hypothetical protein